MWTNNRQVQQPTEVGLSTLVYVHDDDIVDCATTSPYTYSSSTHRFPDDLKHIEAKPLSVTSAELGLGLGLGLGLLSGLGLNFLLASVSFTHSLTLSLDSYCRPTTGKSSSPAGLSTLENSVLQWGAESSLAGQWLSSAVGDWAWVARTGSGQMRMSCDIFAAARLWRGRLLTTGH
jgi:hypothetical protein